MSAIAIIPARGGSKRIPGKNIKSFHGLPMIAYSIKAAIASGLFAEVIVSTDDERVASVARKYGACVPFCRPAKLSDDFATTADVMQHAANFVSRNYVDVKYLCCIYATAPFLAASDLASAYEMLVAQKGGYVFSACRYDFPIQRAFYIGEGGAVRMFTPEAFSARSQDLVPAYHDAGQFYWGRVAEFLSAKMIFSPESRMYELSSDLVQDIDTPEDWLKAELKYKLG